VRKLAFALLALWPAQSFCTSYFLSANGNDTSAGTSPAAPWKTLARLSRAKFSPGDQICLRGGDSFTGTVSVVTNGLTIKSYGAGQATIDAGNGDGVDIYNAGGTAVIGLTIEGGWDSVSQSGNTGFGVSAFSNLLGDQKLPGPTLRNLTIHGFQQCGIAIGAYPSDGSQSGFANVVITGCRVYSNGQAGIESYGYFDVAAKTYAHVGFFVDGCTVYDNEGIVGYGDNTGNGIVLGDVQNATIQFCEAYENGALNGFWGAGPVGIWAWDSDHVTIQNCESHHNQTLTVDGDGFDLDGGVTNSVVQYNYSHDNAGSGLLIAEYVGAKPQSNLTYRYNISQNDGVSNGGGLVLWNGGPGVHDCEFYNNTVFTNQNSPAVSIQNDVQDVTFRNNVVASSHSNLVEASIGQVNVVFQGNDYWADCAPFSINWNGENVTSLAAWRALGQETFSSQSVGMWADPAYYSMGSGQTLGNPSLFSFLTSYRLKPGAPLIGKGIPMSNFGVNPGLYDFYGAHLRQTAPDIGATQDRVGS
jgi:hypothetical protein